MPCQVLFQNFVQNALFPCKYAVAFLAFYKTVHSKFTLRHSHEITTPQKFVFSTVQSQDKQAIMKASLVWFALRGMCRFIGTLSDIKWSLLCIFTTVCHFFHAKNFQKDWLLGIYKRRISWYNKRVYHVSSAIRHAKENLYGIFVYR